MAPLPQQSTQNTTQSFSLKSLRVTATSQLAQLVCTTCGKQGILVLAKSKILAEHLGHLHLGHLTLATHTRLWKESWLSTLCETAASRHAVLTAWPRSITAASASPEHKNYCLHSFSSTNQKNIYDPGWKLFAAISAGLHLTGTTQIWPETT